MSRIKRFLFNYHGLLTGVVFILVVGASILQEVYGWEIRWQVVATVLSLVVSSSFLIQRQKLQETELFNDVFREFNSRYDEMNEELQKIKDGEGELHDEEKSKLVDYFNLCAEEYLFHKRGYVPQEVWRAWKNGMSYYMEDPRIRAFWEQEKETESYYGMEMPAPHETG